MREVCCEAQSGDLGVVFVTEWVPGVFDQTAAQTFSTPGLVRSEIQRNKVRISILILQHTWDPLDWGK